MIRCGLASGYKVWYLATEDKIWYNRFAKLLRQHDTGARRPVQPSVLPIHLTHAA